MRQHAAPRRRRAAEIVAAAAKVFAARGYHGASTQDIKAYHNVLREITRQGIAVDIRQVSQPEVQRIHVEATGRNAFVDALNRGGGRLKLVDAKPSLAAAQTAAARLGIKLAEA